MDEESKAEVPWPRTRPTSTIREQRGRGRGRGRPCPTRNRSLQSRTHTESNRTRGNFQNQVHEIILPGPSGQNNSRDSRAPPRRVHAQQTCANGQAQTFFNKDASQSLPEINLTTKTNFGKQRNDNYRYRNNINPKRNQSDFHILQKIADCNDDDILGEINAKKEFFLQFSKSPIEKLDLFVLTVKILAKICASPYDELKLKMLLIVCNPSFVMQLRIYLMDLPEQMNKSKNGLYWNDQNSFWNNLLTFCESILNLSPSMALQMIRSLIENVSKSTLENLEVNHQFSLQPEDAQKLTELRNKFVHNEEPKANRRDNNIDPMNNANAEDEMEPPEDFRRLPVIPDREQLMAQPFLRRNIVEGGYQDVNHYLDVQFRLLREDCYGPLRKGIVQYLDNPTRPKYDSIKVYKNVKFIGPYVSETKVGLLIKFDEKSNKIFRRINWATSKRLLFGSLVVLSKDNFNKFIVATVLDRDVIYLSKGMLPISIINNDYNGGLHTNDTYTMIESEVYFEPYYHVLKVLRNPRFPIHLPMQNYIVKSDPTPSPPVYLREDKIYEIGDKVVTVLKDETWPTAQVLGLNEKQYEAYKLALTHKVSVIQGPPGTGKTFLGVQIAKTLLTNNVHYSLLVICYTNHALDQFLENILQVTKSIIRIGGQSRNKALDEYNLNKLRRHRHSHLGHALYRDQRSSFQTAVKGLKNVQKQIESLENGVLKYNTVRAYISECQVLERYYEKSQIDPILAWLFENIPDYSEAVTHDEEFIPEINLDEEEEQDNQRSYINFEEDVGASEMEDIDAVSIDTTFLLERAEGTLKYLRSECKKAQNNNEKLRAEILAVRSHIAFFKDMKEAFINRGAGNYSIARRNVKSMSNVDRWCTYFSWINTIMTHIKDKFRGLYETYETEKNAYEEARMNLDREIIRTVKVIGITTTGAARSQKMLQGLRPHIAIVEEAAEILEQHIVSALTQNCHQVILIGDHQQLRPKAANIRLAKDYDMEVSLFERMLRNNVATQRLNIQHRMRPEICALITPHIYPDLINHPSVENKPDVRGVTKNVFFYSHKFPEQHVEDGKSHSNQEEADLALGLANYLVQQDYKPEDITILAAYSGQMFYMRKQRNNYTMLSGVKITILDNYQGEESRIIILSLVRNNNEDQIGFLSVENRVCVALSRAKEGLYIFGNMDMLQKKSELWTKISETLRDMDALGTNLKLKCESHQSETEVYKREDFDKVPEGGCLLTCNYLLSCNHTCPLLCHGYDRDHKLISCVKQCDRIICNLNHKCPLKCKEECKPCQVPLKKGLPCGHDKTLPCFRNAIDAANECTVIIVVTLPDCGHQAEKECGLDIKRAKCSERCVDRLECGHVCMRNCHVIDDPDHKTYVCQKLCAKAKKGCTANLKGDRGNHQCPKQCHETCDTCDVKVKKKRSTCKHLELVACSVSADATLCKKKCSRQLPCGHFCLKKCSEECGGCTAMVEKTILDCNHRVKIQCKDTPKRADCVQPCERILSCGHQCTEDCSKICDSSKCNVLVKVAHKISPCAHQVKVPCRILSKWNEYTENEKNSIMLEYCTEPCNQTLRCDHICGGTCSGCLQGRIHIQCKQPCHQDNICGHSCKEPCNQICPPCRQICEVKCTHSQCKKRCGAPCIPCQEKCERVCPHGACKNRCGEECDRPPCNNPCEKQLQCGHPCWGLCGEPCPDICKICKPDTFPKTFLGDEFEDDAKFLQLQDCSHVFSVEDMDTLMTGDTEDISMRSCPLCRKPIINTSRYKDIVSRMFSKDINPIKERIFGNPRIIDEKIKAFIETCRRIKKQYANVIIENKDFKKAFEAGIKVVNKKQPSLVEVEMKLIYYNILDIIGEYYTTFKAAKLTELEDCFLHQIEIICGSINNNVNKITQQQQADISNELSRMNSIIKLAQIISHPSYIQSKHETKVAETADMARQAVLSWHIYNHDLSLSILKELQETIKLSATLVTQKERAMVVQAIGLKAGHWFKCPNNHYYCIADCGGAMVVSKCIECKLPVGGTNHTLLPNNEHAGEIDNSKFPAWSEHNNNMANFILN